MKILFMEDDKNLAQSVIEELEDISYEVSWVSSSDDASELSYDEKFDLYLFDVNVEGDIDGFELLESLRESGDKTPALFLTSLNQINDMKKGFKAGADDYIKKPFDLDELLLRIESKLPKTTALQLSNRFAIDSVNKTIICDDNAINIPVKEFSILEYLCVNLHQINSAQDIINILYSDNPITIATFRTYIKNIKRHIEGYAEIENVKGVGYRFKVL
ncbi:response regulator [Sulfurimonas aquatica]|uniref:Response regulator n=1 Tax=Sulfurimonas aquatica TaxID=2672570 RepID=A0A975AY08_9BACT|nr:response regulator transcription factor [Sulfurimonas aquatica]QSZ40578.1 response regulator [Sulfurimonas aquatica]